MLIILCIFIWTQTNCSIPVSTMEGTLLLLRSARPDDEQRPEVGSCSQGRTWESGEVGISVPFHRAEQDDD